MVIGIVLRYSYGLERYDMATFLLRKEDENGNQVVIPITVELCGRGIVTNPEEKGVDDGEAC